MSRVQKTPDEDGILLNHRGRDKPSGFQLKLIQNVEDPVCGDSGTEFPHRGTLEVVRAVGKVPNFIPPDGIAVKVKRQGNRYFGVTGP